MMSSRSCRIGVYLLAAWFALSASLALACGKERWSVKTVTDKEAAKVQEAPTPGTINQLRQIAAPINPNLRPDSRYSPTELTTYEVTGYITLIKAEADQDYHIVLADDAGRTMIVESTHPDCALKSRFKSEIDQVRDTGSKFRGANHQTDQDEETCYGHWRRVLRSYSRPN